MTDQAQVIDCIEGAEGQPIDQLDFLVRFLNVGESGPKLRYLVASVKPDLPREPTLSDVISAVPGEASKRQFLEPAVWPVPTVEKETFIALQRWEGTVIECTEETFFARLHDLSSDGPDEEVELLMGDVPDEDRPLVEPGAVFYWSIGHLIKPSGERPRISNLRFRRLPVWSASELKAAGERAEDVAEVFGRG